MAPREKKSNKFDDDLRMKKTYFKRILGLKKKVTELSVLCGNSVGFICYGPDNDLHVWSEPQDNPQALQQIVSQFNVMSVEKRKNHACDLYDFPNLKGSLADELRSYLSKVNSQLAGVRQQKIAVLSKTFKGSSDKALRMVKKSKPSLMVTPEEGFPDKDPVVSDNAAISNHKAGSSKDPLGFGGVFDELGPVVSGSRETVSNLGTCAALRVSGDIDVQGMEAYAYPLDPFTVGFPGGDYFPNDGVWEPSLMNLEFSYFPNDGVWEPSLMNLEFSSTLFADDWMVSGYTYDPLLGATDYFTSSTYQTPVTDNLGSMF